MAGFGKVLFWQEISRRRINTGFLPDGDLRELCKINEAKKRHPDKLTMSEQNLSIGKASGLSSTSTSDDVFAILALDHRQSFTKILPDLDQGQKQLRTSCIREV